MKHSNNASQTNNAARRSHHYANQTEFPQRRRWPRVVLGILAAVLVAMAVVGVLVFVSARGVVNRAHDALTQANTLEHSMLDGNADEMRNTANQLRGSVKDIRDEVHSPLWTAATLIPFVGHDLYNAQVVTDSAYDLTENALVPFTEGVAGIPLADLVQEHSVNTGMLASMRDAVVAVAPVVVRNADQINALTPGVIGRVNALVDELKAPMEAAKVVLGDADRTFTFLLNSLGDGGQTRTYIILAQTNAEIRAGGGFPGSVGLMRVTDGNATLEDFHSVSDVQGLAHDHGFRAAVGQDELAAFEDPFATDAAACTYTPDFTRTGQVAREFWENAYGAPIDGALAMDPVFLQRMLELTGGVTAPDGTVVDGSNAAEELMSGVYWRYGYDEDGGALEDQFFNSVAHESFSRLLDAMGDFKLDTFSKLWRAIKLSGKDHRFGVWMTDGTNEQFIRDLGLDGALVHDQAHPELGVYANDNTWAKLCWYLDIWADVAGGTRNADGSTTYDVTAHFKNTISENDAASAPDYITGYNPWKRSKGDLLETIYIMAPDGATISDYEVHQDTPIPADKVIPEIEYNKQCTLYGCDTRVSHINIEPGGDTTATFKLTIPAGVDAKPTVRTSPLCHE